MKQTYIIAEIGVNHNGDFDRAKEMLEIAASTGVNCVKFQTFKAEQLASRFADTAEYHKKNVSPSENNQLEMLKRYELKKEHFIELKKRCEELHIDFLSTPFDNESIDLLNEIGVDFWKIPSGEINNLPYLLKIAETHKPVILSTGMSDLNEVEYAVNLLRNNGVKELTLLHCNTEYPTPYEDVNLKAMQSMKERFDVEVGYSDHTKGITVSLAAVALGASVIEKHFTLNRNLPGPDHKASMEPKELERLVKEIRIVEQAMGDGIKKVSNSERKNISIARKSIVAAENISQGDILTEKNITTKRPGNGISPTKWFEVLGTKAVKNFKKDELIEL